MGSFGAYGVQMLGLVIRERDTRLNTVDLLLVKHASKISVGET